MQTATIQVTNAQRWPETKMRYELIAKPILRRLFWVMKILALVGNMVNRLKIFEAIRLSDISNVSLVTKPSCADH